MDDYKLGIHVINNNSLYISRRYAYVIDALKIYRTLGDYKDSYDLATYIESRIDTLLWLGGRDTVALKADGTILYGTGENECGVSTEQRAQDEQVFSAAIMQLDTTVALRKDGSIFSQGEDAYVVEVYDSETDTFLSPSNVVQFGYNFLSGFAGVKSDGTLLVGLSGEYDFKVNKVALGREHMYALRQNGTIYADSRDRRSNANGELDVEEWKDIVDIAVIDGSHDVAFGLTKEGIILATDTEYLKKYKNWGEILIAANGGLKVKEDGGSPISESVKTTQLYDEYNRYGKYSDAMLWSDIVGFVTGDQHYGSIFADGTVAVSGLDNYGQTDVSDWKLWSSQQELAAYIWQVPFWLDIKADTSVSVAENEKAEAVEYTIGCAGNEVIQLQQALIDQGFLSGSADGQFGNKTAEAVKAAQKAFGMAETGIADETFQNELYK